MRRGFGYLVCLVLMYSGLMSQSGNSSRMDNITLLNENGEAYLFPWAGGLNSAQFSAIDLNLDGIEDLFVFERTGNRILTFINNGTTGEVDYVFAPSYVSAFPDLHDWALLLDYNNDGLADIFTYHSASMKVYKNISSIAEGLKFEEVTNPELMSRYQSGPNGVSALWSASLDIPAITDVDGDGDIDILTFGPSSTTIYFHENFAADSNDIENFNYHLSSTCWGNFEEDLNSNVLNLNIQCKGGKSGNKHTGSTMLAFDPDHDGDMDMLLGDVTYNNMIFVTNGGDSSYADMIKQDLSYPLNTTAIDLRIFPAAYYLDVDNDGRKDLIVSPNTFAASENWQGCWYYKNVGTSSNDVFELQRKNFLQKEMLDVGDGAYPVFFDYNQDGLMDIVIGNHGYFINNAYSSRFMLLENVGTITQPTYQIISRDYLSLSVLPLNTQLNLPAYNLSPAFGDLDNDGDEDMIIGDNEGHLHYFENNPQNGVANFTLKQANYFDIDVNNNASPFIIDINGDGVLDILSGNRQGYMNYILNRGTESEPSFELIDERYGEVQVKEWWHTIGFSQPVMYRNNQGAHIISGSFSGTIFKFGDITGDLTQPFTLEDTTYQSIYEGYRSIVSLADIDNDGFMEMVVGNYAGGISFFDTELVTGIRDVENANQIEMNIWPNPANSILQIRTDVLNASRYAVQIHNMQGQLVKTASLQGTLTELNISDIHSGMYMMSALDQKGNIVFRTKLIFE